jgi:nucleotide-binding universal stress UspA family protein
MRILIATHDSPNADRTLRFSAQILRQVSEPALMLTVVKDEADRPQAEEYLARACASFEPSIPRMQTRVRVGPPAQEIIREAEEGDYELLIAGISDGARVAERLLGSTALRVAEQAPCPVLIVKGQVGPIRRILLCDSGAEIPSPLGRFTVRLAESIGGEEEVTVLHVMSQISAGPGVRGSQLRAVAEELIQEETPEGRLLKHDLQDLDHPGIRPSPKVRHGLVVDEILAEARGGSYDLVVIGAYRGKGWQRFLLDDLARKLLTQLDRSVLVVPHTLG